MIFLMKFGINRHLIALTYETLLPFEKISQVDLSQIVLKIIYYLYKLHNLQWSTTQKLESLVTAEWMKM